MMLVKRTFTRRCIALPPVLSAFLARFFLFFSRVSPGLEALKSMAVGNKNTAIIYASRETGSAGLSVDVSSN